VCKVLGRKNFFFEKKEAKNFCKCGGVSFQINQFCASPMDKSFLVLFFKKELLAFGDANRA